MSQATTNSEMTSVQSRLMEMLESVDLDNPPKAPPRPAPQPIAEEKSSPQPTVTQRKSGAGDGEAKNNGPGCKNCGSTDPWNGQSYCPRCGFYPQTGRFVDVSAENASDEDELEDIPLWEVVPVWVWIISAGMLSILIWSIVIRVIVPDIQYRGWIGLSQVIIGFTVFAAGHLRGYFIASQDTDKITFATMFVGPTKIWEAVVRRMPDTYRLIQLGAWGMTAVVLGVTIVGLDYVYLLSPGEAARQNRFNPMKMIVQAAVAMATAQSAAGGVGPDGMPSAADAMNGDLPPESLEDAIGNFADAASVTNHVNPDDLSALNGGTGHGVPGQPGLPKDTSQGSSSLQGAVKNFAGASGLDNNDPESVKKIATESVAGSDAISGHSGNLVGGNLDNFSDDANSAGAIQSDGEGGVLLGRSDKGDSVLGPMNATVISAPSSGSKGSGGSKSKSLPDKVSYTIFGYTTSLGGEIRSVLLAETNGSKGRYVNKLSLDETHPQVIEQLESMLEELRTGRPAYRAPYSARWVRPVLVAHISYNGKSILGNLVDGRIDRVSRK